MKPLLAAVILLSAASCGTTRSAAGGSVTLQGTTWRYSNTTTDEEDDIKEYDLTFGANGKTRNTIPADQTPDNDTWSQRGRTVEFAFNDGYARYTGTFQSSTVITGTAVNEVGKRWTWKLVRKGR